MGARPNSYPAVYRGTAILAVLLLSAYPSQAPATIELGLRRHAGRFVPDGRKRIASLVDEAQEKSLRLFGYAPQRPSVTAQVGSVDAVSFDQRTGRFELLVSPGRAQELEPPGNDPVPSRDPLPARG